MKKTFLKTCIHSFIQVSILLPNVVMSRSNEYQEVDRAVESLRIAMLNGEKVKLESIASELLTYGHSGGKIENKLEFVEAFVSGKSKFTDIKLEPISVFISNNTAIVRHLLFGKTLDKGKDPGMVNLSILLVWQKENSSWKLLARQAVKI